WLVLRGIQSLPWRVRAHAENALKLATFLADHRRVEAVHYPGLSSHPAHALAVRQMRAFSGMLSFQVRGNAADALGVAAKVRVFTRATSFGGTDSLIEHRASIEGAGTRTPESLLRVSVGLEHADDLTSVFLVCRATVRHMLGAGGGRIVNIASIAGKEGNATLVPHSAAKAGVIGLTKALAKEVATKNIFVNAVAPAVIGTDLLK